MLFCLICICPISPFFNVFLTQNNELQFSFNVIITCNKIQYIVNYKQLQCILIFLFSYNKLCLITMTSIRWGTYKVRNEIETKRNETKSTKTKRNQQKRNETKRNQRNENEIKRNQRKQNEINENKTK